MANLVISGDELQRQLVVIKAYLGATDKVRLFQNNHTPVVGDSVGDYTEATFGGYAAITLDTWGSVSYATGVARILEILRTWTYSGTPTNNIYGYYVTNSTGSQLRWAQLAAGGPFAINTVGMVVAVQPQYTFQNLP